MKLTCKDCKFWQGIKGAEWGDCYRVCAELHPPLMDVVQRNDMGFVLQIFSVPFDPHDVKYWNYGNTLKEELDELNKVELPDGVRKETIKEEDMCVGDQGSISIKKVKHTYFQTRKDFNCQTMKRGDK